MNAKIYSPCHGFRCSWSSTHPSSLLTSLGFRGKSGSRSGTGRMSCTPTCSTNNAPNQSKLPTLRQHRGAKPCQRGAQSVSVPWHSPGTLGGWHMERDTTMTCFNHAPTQTSHSPCCRFTLGHTAHETHTKRLKLSLCFPSGFWC